MQILVNDQPREVAQQTTLEALLQELGHEPRHVAVEVNWQLVPRTVHSDHMLNEGDRLEIVTLVGGG